jgi:hypothetical protein
MIDNKTLKEYRRLAEQSDMISSLGEYTPPEFTELLDFIDELRKRRTPPCEVCWTVSWQPCEKDEKNAVKDPNGSGYMQCGYCELEKSYRKLLAKRRTK